MTQIENKKKSNLKWILIAVLAVVVVGILAWCLYNAITQNAFDKIFNFSFKNGDGTKIDVEIYSVIGLLLGMFIVIAVGNLLGRITIKGVSLGTSGVFLVAILFGYLCTLIPADMPVLKIFAISNEKHLMNVVYKEFIQNIGLILFVGAVGFIAGPNFFKNLKKNATSYVLLGAVIILTGAALAVAFAFIPGIGADFSIGVLSGSLTTTPGYSAALGAAGDGDVWVTLGHAIAYPFGVIGVVLFVQLMPKILKADMNKERMLLLSSTDTAVERKKGLLSIDPYGITAFAIAVIFGLVLGAFQIPLLNGYQKGCFSLGNTGGVLIMCLVMGHFGRIGKVSMEVPEKTLKVFREIGLIFFLIGAGVSGGVSLVSAISKSPTGAMIVVYGLIGGAVMTIVPMIVGFFVAHKALKLPLLNTLGSITGGMTSTPALGSLIGVAKTDDVASAYASTYPIALVLVVLASQLIVTLI